MGDYRSRMANMVLVEVYQPTMIIHNIVIAGDHKLAGESRARVHQLSVGAFQLGVADLKQFAFQIRQGVRDLITQFFVQTNDDPFGYWALSLRTSTG